MPERFEAGELRALAASIFAGYGLDAAAAATVADNLVEADLRGVHSHGLTRVAIYTERLRLGLVNPRPRITTREAGESLLGVDGDNGMGAVVAMHAATLAVERARRTGSAVVAVRRSNHLGIAGYYSEFIARSGLVALVSSTAPATMAAWGGRTPRFGTNPLSYGVPTRGHPVVADMATSVVARGKVILAQSRGEAIPAGWALDGEGRSTTDPAAALAGVVLPFGGAKGSAIAFLVDVIAGLGAGAAFGTAIPDLYRDLETPQDIGHFMLAFDAARLIGEDVFLDRMDEALASLRACPPADGFEEVLAPGKPSAPARGASARRRAAAPGHRGAARRARRRLRHHGAGSAARALTSAPRTAAPSSCESIPAIMKQPGYHGRSPVPAGRPWCGPG